MTPPAKKCAARWAKLLSHPADHFRHESGHYFWGSLGGGAMPGWIDAFRELFGDERADYAQAQQTHYARNGAPARAGRTPCRGVYATTHPWEDFAETWAHYLHIVDTLETAGAFGLKVKPRAARGALAAAINFDPYEAQTQMSAS